MSKYLITKTSTFRVDSEEEAKKFLEELKESCNGIILKHSIEYKERKAKGEIIDSWYRLTVKAAINDEKEPDTPYSEE